MTTELTQQTIEQDGFIIDVETGEVLGLAKPEFHVTDASSADWVLEKMLDAKASITRENIKLKSITENIESKKRDYQRRIDYLEFRFGAELEAFAAKELEGAKTKTWKGDYGQLKFRTVNGGVRVKDADEALAAAKQLGWVDAIKVKEEFQISKLTPDQKALAVNLLDAFEVKPDSQVFDIKVGGE